MGWAWNFRGGTFLLHEDSDVVVRKRRVISVLHVSDRL